MPRKGLATVDEAICDRAEHARRGWIMPELLRVKGELLRLDGAPGAEDSAAGCFPASALQLAGTQGALAWELRAAGEGLAMCCIERRTGLLRAIACLQPIYDRFAEGLAPPTVDSPLGRNTQLLDVLGDAEVPSLRSAPWTEMRSRLAHSGAHHKTGGKAVVATTPDPKTCPGPLRPSGPTHPALLSQRSGDGTRLGSCPPFCDGLSHLRPQRLGPAHVLVTTQCSLNNLSRWVICQHGYRAACPRPARRHFHQRSSAGARARIR